jgi:hypothetical protein
VARNSNLPPEKQSDSFSENQSDCFSEKESDCFSGGPEAYAKAT